MRIESNSWLITKPIAHRGLWGNGIVENTMSAYKNAVDKGVPIEIDVYLTKDNKVVSFHDTTLTRMTGKDGFIWDFTYEELKNYKILGTDEVIPLLSDILKIAENKIPILIEIKNQPNGEIVNETLKILEGYKGEFAIQSFNPFYIIKVKKLNPNVIRGILSTKYFENQKFVTRFVVSKMPLNFLAKPDFISIRHNDYPVKKRKAKNRVKLAWTLTSKDDLEKVKPFVDNVIYEGFEI